MSLSRTLIGALLSSSLILQATAALPAFAVVSSKKKDKQQPSGTLLLPLTPKIADDGTLSTEPQGPSGTLLLPLTPKIDEGDNNDRPLSAKAQKQAAQKVSTAKAALPAKAPAALPGSHAAVASTSGSAKAKTSGQTASRFATSAPSINNPSAKTGVTGAPATAARHNNPGARTAENSPASKAQQTPALAKRALAPIVPTSPPRTSAQTAANQVSAESGTADETVAATPANETTVEDEKVLKGTVQIIADDTEYDQDKNTFLGTGNAIAIIAGQNSKLEADSILYDQTNNYIDARGNVKILRDGQLTAGSSFKFKVDSDEYLITDPDTELQGTAVVSRTAKGDKDGIAFKNGNFTLPQPLHIMNNALWGPMSSAERTSEIKQHPDAYVTNNPSYIFTARKMIYERYKTEGNLTVYGGRIKFKHFSLPIGKFTANVGGENSRVVLPVTPLVGNNLMVGGTNIGPQFNYAVGKTGAFSWAPLVQFGGATTSSTGTVSNTSKIGAGFKAGYTTDRLSLHLAYGSVSNLLVADLKYRIDQHTQFQSGVNRFLNDGMFGQRRARLLAEVVDNRAIGGIPYLNGINFRTSGGWAQDDPSLINLAGSQYAQLFQQTHTNKVGAYKLQEQITGTTHPIFSVGDSKYGLQGLLYGGLNLRAYSTGDFMSIGQIGPMINARLNRARLQLGYTQSTVSGKSPFIFDEFLQGSQSILFNGDVKLAKWLTVGAACGYNMNAKMMYTKAVTVAIGPDDFKLLAREDFITGFNRVGFDLLYGQPVQFNKLVVKNGADQGQLGGI